MRVSGDPLLPQSALVLSNHRSLADHLIIAWLARSTRTHKNVQKWETIPQVNFFTWFSLWRIPSARTLAHIFNSDENWDLLRGHADLLFAKMYQSLTRPAWVVVFPEVNIWTPSAAHLQQAQAHQYFLPFLEHVLYPRFAAPFTAVSQLAPSRHSSSFESLYHITISYSAPTKLLSVFSSTVPIEVHVHVRTEPLAKVPRKRHKFDKWLECTWVQKDTELNTTPRQNPVVVDFDSRVQEPLTPLLGL